MKRIIRAVLVLALGATLTAQGAAVSHETLTIAGTAVGFSASTITPGSSTSSVTFCYGKVETAQARYLHDGTTPTASLGILADIGDVIQLHGAADIRNFRIIRVSGSAAATFECSRQ